MLHSHITVKDQKKQIFTLFIPEQKSGVNDRSSYTVSHDNKETVFTIEAKDPVALRATINGICKQLIVYEKMKQIK